MSSQVSGLLGLAVVRLLGKAVRTIAEGVRSGQIAAKDARTAVDGAVYRFAQDAKRQLPTLDVFAKDAADQIAKLLVIDSTASKLAALADANADVDPVVRDRLCWELDELISRAERAKAKLTPAAGDNIPILRPA